MSLAEPVVSGIVFGLVLSAMIGPVFITLLHTSLQEGFKAGSHLAFGILLSDAGYIALSYFFASSMQQAQGHKVAFGVIGGLILAGFGVYLATRKVTVGTINHPEKAVHARYTVRGFLLNAANPAVLLFWLSVVGQVKMKEHYEVSHEVTFFATCLVTVFSIDLLKSYGAHRIRKILKPGLLKAISIVSGLVLVVYGIWMLGKPLGWWSFMETAG